MGLLYASLGRHTLAQHVGRDDPDHQAKSGLVAARGEKRNTATVATGQAMGDGRWAMGDGRRQHPSQYVHVYTRTSSKAIPLCVSVAALAWVANSDGLQGSPKNVLVKDSQLFVRRSSASTAARAMLQASGRVSLESCLFASANMCVCYLLAYSPCYRGS